MKTKLYDENRWDELTEALKRGEIVAFPTDTVFGLACVYDNEEAIQRIKDAKGRDASKPLPMMCCNREMMERYAVLNNEAGKLVTAFFPGKMTLILSKRDSVAAYVTNGFPSIGIRIPAVPEILRMIEELGKPLLVTSANLSGEPSLQSWRAVYKSLVGKIDGILCQDAAGEFASTIVDARGEIRLLRLGEIGEEKIKEVLR